MRFRLSLVFLLTVLMITGFASAQSAENAEVELSVVNDDMSQGDNLNARVEISDANASNLSNVFTLGGMEVESTEDREVEYEVTSEDVVEQRENLTVEVFENGSLIGSDSVELELEPVGEYSLKVSPEKVKPGEKVEAKVTYGNQTLERMEYDWNVGFMKAEGEEVGDGPEIGFKTRGDLGREEDEVRVTVRNEEGDVIGSAEESIEFEIYKPEVEGLDVEYGEGEVTVTVSEEKLRERPEVRLGKALDNWTKVEFSPREMSGGAEIKLEQKKPEEFETNKDIEKVAVVEISGKNVQGLAVKPTATISKDWLRKHNLMLSRDKAKAGLYEITDGWKQISTAQRQTRAEGYIDITTDGGPDSSRYFIMESGSEVLGVAGGEGFVGRYAVSPKGECEELSEEEPLPPGWEKINADCRLHEQAERMEERLEEMTERWDETSEEVKEQKEKVKEEIENYRLNEAEEMMEELQEERERSRERESRARRLPPGVTLENETRKELQELNLSGRLPENLSDVYNRSEKLDELFENATSQIKDEEYIEAQETISEIRRTQRQQEGYRRAEELGERLEEIREMKQADYINNQSREKLEQAEKELMNGNVSGAKKIRKQVQKDAQLDRIKEFIKKILQDQEIRNMIKDLLSELSPI